MSDNKNKSNSNIWQLELANKNMELEIVARKQIERSLKDREDRFRTIYKYAPVTYFLCNMDGDFLDGNLQAFNLTGYTNDELFGMNFINLKLIDKTDQQLILKILKRSSLGENTGPDELSLIKKDGSKVIIELSTSPVTIHEQKQILGIAQDITERKKSEDAIRKNRSLLKSILDSTGDGLLVVDEKGRVTHRNIEFNNMWRISLKLKDSTDDNKLIEFVLNQLTNPNEFISKVKELYNSSKSDLDFLHFKDGRIFERYSQPLLDENIIKGRVWRFRDITKRMQVEEDLRESEEKFRSIVSNSPCVIMQTDRQGIISFVNYKYSGHEPAKIIGKTIYDFMPREFHELAKNTINRVFKTGESYSFENLGFSTDDSVVWYRNNVSSIQNSGKTIGVAILATDISEHKQTEIMKNEFIASVSHELRTPLTIIRESLSLLSDELFGKLNKDQEDIVNPCIEDVDRLGRIINNLLDISRMEDQKIKIVREIVDIIKLAQGVVSTFKNKAESKNLQIVFNTNRDSINIYLDKDRIIQVFMNLIGNAIKFTNKGKIEINITENENKVECCIADTGIGIDPNNLGTIFDRFHKVGKVMRAGEKESGLGLSISKGIVKLHKGKIWVDSQLHEGSKFYFVLPHYKTEDIIIEHIENDIKKVEGTHTRLSLLLLRLNNYADIETNFGGEKANKVIKLILKIIHESLAPGEFAFIKEKNEIILFSDITRQNIHILFSKLGDMIKELVLKIDIDLNADLSYGYSLYPDDGSNAEQLLQHSSNMLLKNVKA